MDLDPRQLEELVERYPALPRSRIQMALEAYGDDQDELERALQGLAAAEAMRLLRAGQAPLT